MRKLSFSESQMAEMERLYRVGFSTGEIAKQFGCLMGSIWKRLVDRGVQMRPCTARRPRRTIHSHGYILIGGEYEHRKVAETMLGRPLLAGECVHHKNGNRQDNRPENLEIVSSHSAHMVLHRAERETWRPEEDSFLIEHYGQCSAPWIAQYLRVGVNRVRNRVRRLQNRGVLARQRAGRKLGFEGEAA